MQRPIIEVKNLSKKYRLGVGRASRLRDELDRLWGRSRGRYRAHPQDELWALRGVSFEVQRGEVVGIVGGNGAGKSTLLKILSRITRQTFGEVVLRGRVASLLEIGTGFHPDLTGRENIFLNGAIMGMTRVEIKKKFDEIVAFAEIERFIDTPVKHYSSGMYVRLAFAVAAHLEPEILIVDEVLAVGDVEFQRKCIGKMRDVAGFQGRTVLFVSHNMAAVTALCLRAAYLKNGNLMMVGATGEVLSAYLQNGRGATYEKIPDPGLATSRSAWIRKAWIGSKVNQGAAQDALTVGEKFTLNVELCVPSGEPIELITSFHDQLRRPLWTSTNSIPVKDSIPAEARVLVRQHYVLPQLTIPGLTIDLATADSAKYPFLDHVIAAIALSIAQPAGADYKAQNTNYPFLVEPEQEVFVLGD
jgi:ABC-type polysaccharide/polyol phosphate transport system ATPase subunit